jgi:hypothetical protein
VAGLSGPERQTAQQKSHDTEGDDLPEQHAAPSFDAQVLAGDE